MIMPTHGWKAAHRPMLAPQSRFYEGRFGRMFRKLPAWEPRGRTDEDKENFLADLSAASFEAAGPDPSLDNAKIPSAYTYFGQFVDHDITFDTISSMEKQNDPDRLHNFRTPRFDLDNIYGRGPADQPYLYQDPEINPGRNDANKVLIGSRRTAAERPTGEEDLPRNAEGVALIGDPRNDENIIVSQLQLALLKFHNRMVDRAKDRFDDPEDVFREAQRLTRWHYQWVVVHDFLKRVCGKRLVDDLLCAGGREPRLEFYRPKHRPYIPVEFSVAAYRMGHSMVRAVYHLNDRLREIRGGRPLPIFGPEDTEGTLENLRGFRPLPGVWTVQWDLFVGHGGSAPQPSRLIDTKLAAPLMTLPAGVAGHDVPVEDRRRSLAFRNLVRGWRMGLPSGQSVARYMGKPVIGAGGKGRGGDEDPLWLYILREAHEQHGGERLGDVGATIVTEVFVGLLAGDPLSFHSVRPQWKPELDGAGPEFELVDLLRHAGAPMTRAEVEAMLPTG